MKGLDHDVGMDDLSDDLWNTARIDLVKPMLKLSVNVGLL